MFLPNASQSYSVSLRLLSVLFLFMFAGNNHLKNTNDTTISDNARSVRSFFDHSEVVSGYPLIVCQFSHCSRNVKLKYQIRQICLITKLKPGFQES